MVNVETFKYLLMVAVKYDNLITFGEWFGEVM